jgi:hypothetical protein
MEIKFGKETFDMVFNMNSIKAVMLDAGMETFADLQGGGDIAKQLDFGLLCAYHAINEAADIAGKPKPFILLADLGRKITNFHQLLPAMEGFSNSVTEFFKEIQPEGK